MFTGFRFYRWFGCSCLLLGLVIATVTIPRSPASACDPLRAQVMGFEDFGNGLKTDPINAQDPEVHIGPTGVTGTGMFLQQMIRFDPVCEDYLANAMDWVTGEALTAHGSHLLQGDKLKFDTAEDLHLYFRTNGAFIAGALADAHTIHDDRGYLDVAVKTLFWIGAEAIQLADSVLAFVENGLHTPINLTLVEGLAGIGYHGLHIAELFPGTEAATYGGALSNAALTTLAALAVHDPDTGGKKWPLAYKCSGATGYTVPNWCSGAAGIVNFFLEKYRISNNPIHRQYAEDGLLYIMGRVTEMMGGEEIDIGWGHGVSGIIAQCVKAWQILQDVTYLEFAETMGDYVLAHAITTPYGIKFYDDNMHCQHGNLGVMHGLDDLALESQDPQYLDALNQLVDHLHATQVRSEYGLVIPAYEDSNFTATGQGWGQASLLLTHWGEPDVLQHNPKFIELCENFRDFLLATHIEEEHGWKWLKKIYYTTGGVAGVEDEAGEGLPQVTVTAIPNPADPGGNRRIQFHVESHGADRFSLRIYDLRGRLVRLLASNVPTDMPRTFTWDGRDRTGQRVASGVYLYEMASKQNTSRKKLVLMR